MLKSSWSQIEKIYSLPSIGQDTIDQFKQLKSSQDFHTKGEGSPRHYCSFFLPYDKKTGRIYLCHHKKANDWIPPGGHIEPGETPIDAAIREMSEELRITITKSQLEPWNLSVKEINRPDAGCMAHYDIWHLVHIPEQIFDYDHGEYYDAAWFGIAEGVAKIEKNLDFAQIISNLSQA